jgi:hypothetical protein
MTRRKQAVCAYCGRVGPITQDHIPPKNLFPKPRAADLITVPCCLSCREGWSKDDEYFWAIILNSELVESSVDAEKAIQTLFRALERKEHQRLLLKLSSDISWVNAYTESGLFLGRKPAMKYDRPRMNRVISRIVRGLFFKETGRVFPETHELIPAMSHNPKELEKLIRKIRGFRAPVRVGNKVFQYTVAFFVPEDQTSSIWVMSFYDCLPIVAFVRPKDRKHGTLPSVSG